MIQIRNVPDALHRRLKSRAALAGMSLSEYLLQQIREVAERPTIEEMRARLARRRPSRCRSIRQTPCVPNATAGDRRRRFGLAGSAAADAVGHNGRSAVAGHDPDASCAAPARCRSRAGHSPLHAGRRCMTEHSQGSLQARPVQLGAVRLGQPALLHHHHDLHLRALLRQRAGGRSGEGPVGLGLHAIGVGHPDRADEPLPRRHGRRRRPAQTLHLRLPAPARRWAAPPCGGPIPTGPT